MRWLLPLVLIAAISCSSPGSASAPSPVGSRSPSASAKLPASPTPTAAAGGTAEGTQSSPSPNPTPSPIFSPTLALAVLVDLFAGGNSYNLALVRVDGKVAARASATKRSEIADASALPYVSASKSRVYYLDGDRTVRFLKPDGATGVTTSVPGGPHVHATFAVTPDDSRIAVGLLDYSVSPVKLTLYVEDLGGAHHAVIFTSTNHYVWPVAWHSGHLALQAPCLRCGLVRMASHAPDHELGHRSDQTVVMLRGAVPSRAATRASSCSGKRWP